MTKNIKIDLKSSSLTNLLHLWFYQKKIGPPEVKINLRNTSIEFFIWVQNDFLEFLKVLSNNLTIPHFLFFINLVSLILLHDLLLKFII